MKITIWYKEKKEVKFHEFKKVIKTSIQPFADGKYLDIYFQNGDNLTYKLKKIISLDIKEE